MGLGARLKLAGQVAKAMAVGVFSDDSMKQAYGLLPGVLPGSVGTIPTRGTAEYLRAYSQMPWLRAVVGRISTATARVEWQLFVDKRKKGDGKARRLTTVQRAGTVERKQLIKTLQQQDELTQIDDHPLLDVLHGANEFQTGYAMRKLTQIYIDLVGDAFWLKERDGQGTVTAIWPIPPHWILATPTPSFRFFRVGFRGWRGLIPDTEWVWFSDPDPLNPYGRGTGAAMALGDELETDEYAARNTKLYFLNQARPDLLVWPKNSQGMSQQNVDRLEEDWTAKTQGFWKAFKPYFLTREVGVQALEQNFRAQQLVQLREFERDLVMQYFGVPPEILGVLEHSNRSTIDAADFLMAHYVLEPRLEFQRTVLQERFVPEFDERLILDYVSPVAEDRASLLEAAKAGQAALSLDEWRKIVGLPPMDDEKQGALHIMPTGTSFVDIAREAEEAAKPKPDPFDLLAAQSEARRPPPGRGTPPGQQQALPQPKSLSVRRAMALSTSLTAWQTSLTDAIAVARTEQDDALAKTLTAMMTPPRSKSHVVDIASQQEGPLARKLAKVWSEHAARLNMAALTEAVLAHGVAGDVIDALQLETLNVAQSRVLTDALTRMALRGAGVGADALRRRGIVVRAGTARCACFGCACDEVSGCDKDCQTCVEGCACRVTKQAKAGGLSVDFAGVNPLVTAWANEHAGALVVAQADVRAAIADLVARANEEGIAPDDLARMIRDVVGLLPRQVEAVANFREDLTSRVGVTGDALATRVARYANAQRLSRATTIARTEVVGSLNAGQQMLWDEAVTQGVIQAAQFVKTWIVTDDELLEPECEAMADEEVAIGEAFSAGVMFPPLHPNCRCTVGLVNA